MVGKKQLQRNTNIPILNWMAPKVKMKSEKILLIGGKGGSVSEGIYKCLKMAGYKNIILLEYTKNAALIYRVKDHIITDKNPDHGDDYVKELIKICHSDKIKVIIPGATWEAKIISKYQKQFDAKDITCLVNNFDVIEICSDKRKTAEFLVAHGMGTPRIFKDLEESLGFFEQNSSLIVKPVSGRGSQNVYRVRNGAELQATLNYFEVMKIPYIIQEHISDDDHEYTVGVLSDRKGLSAQSIVMQRFLWGGATGYGKVVEHGYINEFCEDLAKQIKSTGPLNIQLRLDENEKPIVFEINPRFSGSAPMRALAGFNEPDFLLRNFLYSEKINAASVDAGSQYYRSFQEIQVPPNSKEGEIKNFL